MGIQEETKNHMSSLKTRIVAIATNTDLTKFVKVKNVTTNTHADDVYNLYPSVDGIS